MPPDEKEIKKQILEYRRIASLTTDPSRRAEIHLQCGIWLIIIGEIQEALEILLTAQKDNPDSPSLLRYIRDCCIRLKKWKELTEFTQKEISILEKGAGARIAVEVARILETEGEEKLAYQLLKNNLDGFGSERDFRISFLRLSRKIDGDDKWREIAENIISNGEENRFELGVRFDLASYYFSTREITKCIPHLCAILNNDTNNLPALKLLIDSYINLGEYKKTQELFNKYSIPDDIRIPLSFYCANELARSGERKLASALIEEHLRSNENIIATEVKRIIEEEESSKEINIQKLYDLVHDKFFIKYIAYSLMRSREGKSEQKEIFSVFQGLLETDHEDIVILKQLERFIDIDTQPEGMVQTLEVESQMIKDKRLLVGIMLMLAQVYLNSGDPKKAKESLTAAHNIDPGNFNILKLLEKTLVMLEEWEELTGVLEKQAEVLLDPKEVLYMYYRIGEIFESNLNESGRAARYYEKVLELSPNYIPALRALRRVYMKEGRWNELLEIIRKEIEITSDGNTLIELTLEKASISEKFINDPDAAQKAYSEVLESSPGNPIAIAALKRIYRKTEQWEKLRDLLIMEVSYIEEAMIRADAWYELGHLYEYRFKEYDEALNCYSRCLKEQDGYVPAYSAIESLLKKTERLEALKEFYKDLIEKLSNSEAKISVLLKLANLSQQQQEEVQEAYNRALELSPYNPLVLDILEHYFLKIGDYSRLLDIIDRKTEIAKDERTKSVYLLKRGNIQEAQLNDIKGAIRSYEEAIERTPGISEGFENLIRIQSRMENYPELVRVLQNYSETVKETEKRKELLLRLGEIYHRKLNDIESAIKCYRELADSERPELSALRGLCEIFENQGRLEDAANVQSIIVRHSKEEAERADELRKLSVLYENSGKVEEAASSLKKAFEILKEDSGIILEMERLLFKLGKWHELYNIFNYHLGLSLALPVRFELLRNTGRVAYEHLNLTKEAVSYLDEALKIEPRDLESLYLLDRIYTSTGEKEKLANILERLSELVSEPDERIELLRRLGRIYHDSKKYPDAIRVYETLRELAPDDRDCLMALDSLYSATEQPEKQYEIDSLLLKKTQDKHEIAELHYKMGCAQESLGLPEKAMTHYNHALEGVPSHIPSLRAKVKIFQKEENFSALADGLHDLAKSLTDEKEKSLVLTERGTLLLEKLKQEEDAINSFSDALSCNKENHEAVLFLSKIHFKRKNWSEVIRLSRDFYDITTGKAPQKEKAEFLFRMAYALEQNHRADEAFPLYELSATESVDYMEPLLGLSRILLAKSKFKEAREMLLRAKPHVEKSGDRETLFFVLFNLGVASYQIEDFQASIESLESAKRIKAVDSALLEELAGVYELVENWQRCAENLEEWLSLGISKKRELFLLRLGKLYSEKLNKPKRAFDCLREAINVKPDFISGHVALVDLLLSQENWSDAVLSIEELLRHEKDKNQRSKWLLKLASLLFEKTNEPEKAVEIARRLIAEGETTIDGYQLLAKIHTHQKDWNGAIEIYSKINEIATSGEAKKSALMERGRILKDKLNKPKVAIDDFRSVLRFEPKNLEAHLALADIFDKDPSTSKEAIKEHMAIIDIDPARIESYRSIGRIYENLREYDRAYCLYSILKTLNIQDEMEKVFLNSIASRVSKKPQVQITNEDRERYIIHPSENIYLRQFWRTITNEIDDFYPPDLEKHGVTKKDVLPSSSPENIMIAANEAAGVLNLKDFKICKSQTIDTVALENTSPPSIIIPSSLVARMKLEELRFFIGLWLEHVVNSHVLPLKIGQAESKKVIQLLWKTFQPEVRVDGMNEEEAQRQSKKMYKALSRRTRHAIEDLLTKSGRELINLNFTEYINGIRLSALRGAYLLVNDLNIVLKILPFLKIDPSYTAPSDNILGLMKSSPFISDIFLYTVSEKYFEIRRQLKLSILS